MRWLRELITIGRDALPEGLRVYVEHEAFLWILVVNIVATSALLAWWGADGATVKEFGPFVALAALCAAVAEFDLVQRWAGRETMSSAAAWMIMLPLVGVALAVGVWAHDDRVGAARAADESHRQMEEINVQLRSPDVQEGMRAMAQIRERRASHNRDRTSHYDDG